ncbi:23S rRNA (adenine(2503)-C(2))-methyltransferase RlmN [Tissierella sp. MSJ-40]|uniref:Probable dual-specificity RNA methyltransferase RlmN n=1 Tax=Tissierella simiarum TaxID=2841534 RepID=A0ABS6E4D1_9FIRM|nr:23S rRNA (adenine(2503)-C(2))-methyltransferase RlmN [Tissierella simiarum]MBU5437761.1 23S rRNA (adenine(2503)-C(2))-methyltransferase RlmN [Tissierella simiarum]
MDKVELNSLTLQKLREYMVSIGEKSFRGNQIFSYFHKNFGTSISEANILPRALRDKLKDCVKVNNIKIFKRFDSKIDNTKKYLYLLEDENIIESVLMEYNHGISICVSTQVGCKMGCSFCASTKEGLIRNLTPAEMVNQIYMMEKDTKKSISNIVLMGSGEPLDNYDNTMKFINIIHDKEGHNISLRNITLSTCGVVPRIYDLAKEGMPITLSISLHSPFDEDRKKIMPIATKYSIDELMEACKYYGEVTKRRITFEYTLIENVNDREEDIKELLKILRGVNCHINLIPLNPIKEFNEGRPEMVNIQRFQRELAKHNIAVTIRREMGGDISASCGQLRRRYSKSSDLSTFQ